MWLSLKVSSNYSTSVVFVALFLLVLCRSNWMTDAVISFRTQTTVSWRNHLPDHHCKIFFSCLGASECRNHDWWLIQFWSLRTRQKWLILHSSCIYCCLTIHRMNNGPVLGHEEDVGRRTTFRLFYPESVFSDPTHNDPNTTAVLIVFKPQDLRWLLEVISGNNIVSWQNYLVPITFSISP